MPAPDEHPAVLRDRSGPQRTSLVGPRPSPSLHHSFTAFLPTPRGAPATLASMHQRERRTVGIRPVPRLVLLLLALAALTLGAAGCGRDDDDEADAPTTTEEAAGEYDRRGGRRAFGRHRDRRLEHGRPADDGRSGGLPRTSSRTSTSTVGISGTGGGFERFCAGETDISNASRPIDDEEEVAALRRSRRRLRRVPGRCGRADRRRQPRERLGHLPDRRSAEEDLGAGGRGQDHELEPGRPELPGPGARPRGPGHRLGHLRLLHRRDQRRGGREPRRLHRQRGRQRHRAGGRRRARWPRLPRATRTTRRTRIR